MGSGRREMTIDELIEALSTIPQPCHRCTLPDCEYEVHLKLCPMQNEYEDAAAKRYQQVLARKERRKASEKRKRKTKAETKRKNAKRSIFPVATRVEAGKY